MDDSDYHDRLQRAVANASMRTLQMVNGLSGLLGSLTAVLAVGVSLLVIQPILLPLAVAAALPVLVASLKAGRALYRFNVEQSPTDRQRTYLQFLLTRKESAKDIRSYNLAGFLRRRFVTLYDARIEALSGVVRSRVRRGVVGSALTALLSGAALAVLIALVENGRLSLASAGAAAAALVLLGTQLQSMASGMGLLYESSLYVQDYASFIREPLETTTRSGMMPAPADFDVITMDDVTFTYPNARHPALQNVSIQVPNSGLIALVGENGSGKTTLAKLLAALYEPDSGCISWDGVDIRSFDVESLRDRVATLFQDFTQFHVTARENISWGRWQLPGDEAGVRPVAERTDALSFLEQLPDGFDTHLSPEFLGGVELSGGQWQRVALARALFRSAPLVILDEPTASLDPRAEAALFRQVREMFAGCAVLLITHRLVSARHADHIYVLERGRVVEEGRHGALMRMDGRYAKLFNLQRSAYGD